MADFDWQLYLAEFEYLTENNKAYLADLLRSSEPLTESTRNFIANVLLGKIKRKTGRVPKLNHEIFYDYEECLKSGMTHQQTDERLSLKYPGKEFGSITKAYQRMKPEIDECHRYKAEESYAEMVEIEQRAKADIAASRITEAPISMAEEQYIYESFQSMPAEEKEYWRQRYERSGQN